MFRLFGFDVQVRTGFLVFLGLVVLINRGSFGLWLAGAIAGFTLVHELGHAVAARSAGADAAISLDFMAGYTSFRPRTPLGAGQRALISVAGPAAQIGSSVAVLAAMGIQPLDIDAVRDSDAAAAIWWAGPMIGILNLIPVLPLDGGHLAQTGVEKLLRRPALREMAIASLVLTIGTAVALAATGRTGFTLFIAFLAIGQLQLVQATSPKRRQHAAAQSVWRPDDALAGLAPASSPWEHAHRAIVGGDPIAARQAILTDLTQPRSGNWRPPTDAPPESLRAVVAVLPDELPVGNPFSARVLVQVLYSSGEVRRAGDYAARCFAADRDPVMAVMVARAASRMGDAANALAWVEAATGAADGDNDRGALAYLLDHSGEFAAMRSEPRFVAARHTVS